MVKKQESKRSSELAQSQKNANYKTRMEQKEKQQAEMADKMQVLEKKELELIEMLKATSNNQRNAVIKLEGVIKDGYKYYLETQSEKRDLYDIRGKLKQKKM